jgi:hypothetical protein
MLAVGIQRTLAERQEPPDSLHKALTELQLLDSRLLSFFVCSQLPPCIEPSRTSEIVTTRSNCCTAVQ